MNKTTSNKNKKKLHPKLEHNIFYKIQINNKTNFLIAKAIYRYSTSLYKNKIYKTEAFSHLILLVMDAMYENVQYLSLKYI